MSKTAWIALGFLLFIFSILSLILNLVGVDFTFLRWLRIFGDLPAFLLKVVMAAGGLVIVYLQITDWRKME